MFMTECNSAILMVYFDCEIRQQLCEYDRFMNDALRRKFSQRNIVSTYSHTCTAHTNIATQIFHLIRENCTIVPTQITWNYVVMNTKSDNEFL